MAEKKSKDANLKDPMSGYASADLLDPKPSVKQPQSAKNENRGKPAKKKR